MLFLFCVSEPVKVLLRCDLVVGHAIVALFRPHIHHKANGEKVKVSDGNADFGASQEEQGRGHFTAAALEFF